MCVARKSSGQHLEMKREGQEGRPGPRGTAVDAELVTGGEMAHQGLQWGGKFKTSICSEFGEVCN